MKKALYILLFVFSFVNGFSQTDSVIGGLVDPVQPEFPGGMVALNQFLSSNIKYPVDAMEKGLQGKVYVKFTILKDGRVDDVKLLRGITGCEACDEEALRVVKMFPNWIPGRQDGNNVDVYYNMPINFKLN